MLERYLKHILPFVLEGLETGSPKSFSLLRTQHNMAPFLFTWLYRIMHCLSICRNSFRSLLAHNAVFLYNRPTMWFVRSLKRSLFTETQPIFSTKFQISKVTNVFFYSVSTNVDSLLVLMPDELPWRGKLEAPMVSLSDAAGSGCCVDTEDTSVPLAQSLFLSF